MGSNIYATRFVLSTHLKKLTINEESGCFIVFYKKTLSFKNPLSKQTHKEWEISKFKKQQQLINTALH